VQSGDLALSSGSVTFGSVVVGTTSTQTITASNSGSASLTVSAAKPSSPQFFLASPTLPFTIAAGQSAKFSVAFTPTAATASSGSISITSNASDNAVSLSLSGSGISAGQLSSNPASLSFVNVVVDDTQTQSATLTNSGGQSVTLSQATVTGAGFSLSGLSFPLTIAGGQSATFNVEFAPQSAGTLTGNLAFSSNASNSTLNVALSGAALAPGSLATSPTSLSFGSVLVGSSQQQSVSVTNTGGTSVTISQASASGTGFSMSSSGLPLTLAAGKSASLTVTFAPQSAGTASGSAIITSNAPNPTLTIPLSGTAVAPGGLSATPSSLSFTSIQAGDSETLSEVVKNTGGSSLTISQVSVLGAEFSVTGITPPVSLTSGQSYTFGVGFAPQAPGSASGSISITSDGSNPSVTIPLSGSATAAGQLGVSPSTLNFNDVAVGSSANLSATLSATGASVTVNSANPNSSEYTFSGLSLPVTIGAGGSAGFTITFTPQSTGSANAALTFVSNAANSPTTALTGNGTPPPVHSVLLTWTASGSPNISGYNIYRGTQSGGPYPTKVNSTLNASTSYTDTTVADGQTYYYVTTAVNSSDQESAYSTPASAIIPPP
jgi:Abnormal spindle-like microcephaly-assoc'd, ASPM-SPD-2-Hydin